MRSFAVIAAVTGLAAASAEWSKGGDWHSAAAATTAAPVYVTEVVTAYTTYCPSATQVTHNGITYTVTSATTLTITNCPCTVTRPIETTPASVAPVVSVPVVSSVKVSKPAVASTGAPAGASSYFPSMPAASTAAATATAPAPYTGAASKAQVAGAGLLAVFGAVAAAL